MSRSPFPLQWPDGWARARGRRSSNFDKTRGFNSARDGVLHELRLFRASHVVITSNLPTNSKGLPHTTSQGHMSDPGISVWWVKNGKEHVIACDRWWTAVENMRAIELSIGAMRGMDRWGATEMVEKAFAGFASLPPGSGEENAERQPLRAKTWREVLGMYFACEGLSPADQLVLAKSRHRTLIKTAHPDAGGSHEVASNLNAALAQAEAELR